MNLHDVPNKHVFRTESNHWFRIYWHSQDSYQTYNDLGIISDYWEGDNHGKVVQIEKSFLGIRENEAFELILPKNFNISSRNMTGDTRLLFKTLIGSRVVCEMKNYKFEIPFWFKTTDPRVEKAEAFWKISSGRIFNHLIDNMLSISWKENKIILSAGYGLTVEIPSEEK